MSQSPANTEEMRVTGYEALRVRLGFPVVQEPRVRRELIPRRRKPKPPVILAPVLPIYAPFNFYGSPSAVAIVHLVGLKHGFRYHELIGTARGRSLMAARREAVRLVASHCGWMSLVQIGRVFHKNHATIINLLRPKGQSRHRSTKRETIDG